MKKSNHLEKLYKSSLDHLEKPVRLGWRVILLCFILTLIFGFLAGLGGGLLVLITRTIKIPFYKEFNLDELLPKREITIKTREVVSVIPDEQIEELARQVQNQVVKIFLKKKDSKKILEQIYPDKDSLGQGFILTNDGWIISHRKVVSEAEKEYIITNHKGKIYSVEKILLDPLTEVVFLKIEARDLAIVKFADQEEVFPGQQVLILDGSKVKIARTKDITFKIGGLIESTDKFSRFIQLDRELEDSFIGSPVINLKGSVIGAVTTQLEQELATDLIIPTTHFKSLINQVLEKAEELESGTYLTRPAMGLDYLDLAQVRGITDKRFKDLKKGALVWGPPTKDSAAEKAGLKNADVILKVNNDLVNGRHNLTELIQEYKAGDKIELTILRGGREEKVEVELGNF